jgi:nucleoside-diphosphate-sugar epimerase
VGDGLNRWPAVHRLDAAVVYRLALEKNAGVRYHAVAESGIPFREIASVIGRHLNLPVASKTREQANEHFGWFAQFAAGRPSSIQRVDSRTAGLAAEAAGTTRGC